MSDAAAKPPMPEHPGKRARPDDPRRAALIGIRDYARLAARDTTGSARDYLHEIIAMAERGLKETV